VNWRITDILIGKGKMRKRQSHKFIAEIVGYNTAKNFNFLNITLRNDDSSVVKFWSEFHRNR
jgi:hypothetical protein